MKGNDCMDNFSESRKNFRFPAFDDNVGVKLPKKHHRVLFQDEVSKVEQEAVTATKTSVMSATAINETAKIRNKNHLINYGSKIEGSPQTKRKSAITAQKKLHATPAVSGQNQAEYQPLVAKKAQTKEKREALGSNYSDRGYFVPKHIPASMISEQKANRPVSKQALLESMKTAKHSYLLFDTTESSAYGEKNKPNTLNEIPVTRKQFKKIKKDPMLSPKENFADTLPQTRTEIKQALLNAKNGTAYGKKQKKQVKETPQKRHRLEKSLAGIMEENASSQANKYFD
ncbi:hypothetical protein ACFFIF_02100 [Vagococcus entomophilus]|uniref:Uncharacterized protein n=1 Tax=Vagococcus entomophilus TaxID=1160095 RepID=A0A430AKH1_9ENTE|nr:hypothetical protein [Vagococcus entomophilus]RSU08407.1 hypothetical protein CBF30_03980 [Vagococcus entomophilus]